jgi:hypothetical protein
MPYSLWEYGVQIEEEDAHGSSDIIPPGGPVV